MYSAIIIFLVFLGAFAGTAISVNTGTIKRIKQQQNRRVLVLPVQSACTKAGIYTSSAEEYYLIH